MSMPTHPVAVLGASGYAGGELLRYLNAHPSLRLSWATADSNAGKPLGEVAPHLVGLADVVLQPMDAATVPDVDIAFLALPHGAAAETGRTLAERGIRVVDFSADWRLQDPSAYDRWYGWAHPHPDQLAGWVYGLPETHRTELAGASKVANPGCYPTAAILALSPLLAAGAIATDGIVVSAATGVSGAGRKVAADYLFSEMDSSVKAYGVGTHRHTPEIEQGLSRAASRPVLVTFAAHLAPMTRGLLTTCYARMTSGTSDVLNALEVAYKDEPFVHVLTGGIQPGTKSVSGSNHALIGVAADERTGTAVITCAIDNLGKGAAGQAVQCANLMLGLDEGSGLETTAVFP
jgi:N-acetyl-gamma-glutamyl-phosphate reductase